MRLQFCLRRLPSGVLIKRFWSGGEDIVPRLENWKEKDSLCTMHNFCLCGIAGGGEKTLPFHRFRSHLPFLKGMQIFDLKDQFQVNSACQPNCQINLTQQGRDLEIIWGSLRPGSELWGPRHIQIMFNLKMQIYLTAGSRIPPSPHLTSKAVPMRSPSEGAILQQLSVEVLARQAS